MIKTLFGIVGLVMVIVLFSAIMQSWKGEEFSAWWNHRDSIADAKAEILAGYEEDTGRSIRFKYQKGRNYEGTKVDERNLSGLMETLDKQAKFLDQFRSSGSQVLSGGGQVESCATNLYEFLASSGEAEEAFVFQLDARQPWQETVMVNAGDVVDFTATGEVCGPSVPTVGPNGQDGLARTSGTRPEEFPVGDAQFQALVARVGSTAFQVGSQKTYIVPNGIQGQPIEMMVNYRMPELRLASGGFLVRIKIRNGS